jgi:hypothetical protein
MTYSKNSRSVVRNLTYNRLLLATALLAAVTQGISAQNRGVETIDATARGTSTQMGQNVSVKVTINRFSTPEEEQAFFAAFQQGQNQGLVDALQKAPSVGRIAITGTVGYDLSYIWLTRTPAGRRITFVTSRRILMAEARNSTQSKEYNLTAGAFDLNDSDKSKSSGTLYPATQLILNKDGQLQFDLRRNPWQLVGIIDWNQAGSKE